MGLGRSSHVIPTQACAVVGIYGCDFVRRGCAALHRLLKVRHPYGVPLSPVGTTDDKQVVSTPADKMKDNADEPRRGERRELINPVYALNAWHFSRLQR